MSKKLGLADQNACPMQDEATPFYRSVELHSVKEDFLTQIGPGSESFRTNRLVADDVMLITDGGTLVRTRVAEISVLSRNTQGVKLIAVQEGERLITVERIETDGEAAEDADSEPEAGDGGDPDSGAG